MPASLVPTLACTVALQAAAWAGPSLFERVSTGVYVVRDDNGFWAGGMSRDITHQNSAPYQARKTLDFGAVPESIWAATRSVRIAAYFMVRDYSVHANPPANGLDESYEIVVNGHVHTFPTGGGAPVFRETGPPAMAWFDHVIPKSELRRGANEIVVRKSPSAKNDDYLYLGIDLSAHRGASAVTFDGSTWRTDVLTIPGGNGEYMVRAYLIAEVTRVRAVWQPRSGGAPADPARLIGYAGPTVGKPAELRMEWDADAIDLAMPMAVEVSGPTPVTLRWVGRDGTSLSAPAQTSRIELPANRTERPSGVLITGPNGAPPRVNSVTLHAGRAIRPPSPPIDMCPPIAKPAGRATKQAPQCRVDASTLDLGNGTLQCRFSRQPTLRMTSLVNRLAAREMLRSGAPPSLFVIRAGGKTCAGSRDFHCDEVRPIGGGFEADLSLAEPPMRARLTVRVADDGLRMGLEVTNVGSRPLDFTLAFPVIEGLSLSSDPRDDYYFYPLGGGIIAPTPALIRTTYGDHQALYQCMDLFSPSCGAGLSLRVDDPDGWHKVLALRKCAPGMPELNWERITTQTPEEYKPANPMPETGGTGMAVEYFRRTRAPGASFSAAPVVLSAHAGDWHAAMRSYSDWAHRVWRFRPMQSQLRRVHNMVPRGWGQDILFREGGYRRDLVDRPVAGMARTMTDCLEIMSWWEWSPVGPFGVPLDRLTLEQKQTWEPYIVKDPVTGRMMWNNQPNDYGSYNDRFGGLAALRKAIEGWRKDGALVTLYTDPFRLDENCPVGRQRGKEWGVVGPDGKLTAAYEVLNPCHDTPAVRQWVARTTERVLRETGADGIRLDEYGHAGYVCFSMAHPHSYVERGVSQWNKGVAETAAMVRAAMDRIRPDLVLTTEHPGYDYLMRSCDGTLTYDLSVQACPLRPLECNLQRFYFPECKPYELDLSGSPLGMSKKFWNAVGSFGPLWPEPMYRIVSGYADVYASRDCEPLLPTLTPRVYVNRFGSGNRAVWHVYNATGHTVDGPVARVPVKPGDRVVDLLTGQTCRVDAKGVVSMALARDGIACLRRVNGAKSPVTPG